ncbi:MAG: cyclic nucleotide-binding domain-containing protein [Betaproteobacteria bacterium]|nr:cyclic nucleotide-binding domain-containing protein [Betaproteobacteria bacterium]
MLERFQGKEGRVALLNVLRNQFLIDGNSDIADKIASAAQIREYSPGIPLFSEGERGSDLYFILAGQVSISMDVREIATVSAGMHVGEIGLLEPFRGRSANVIAKDTVVAALVSQTRFTEIARFHPELWRRMAMELGRRLVKAQARG